MKFTETSVHGAYIIDVNRIGDDRGFFGRLWCEKEMAEQGLVPTIKQSNVGFSPYKGTLRGLHYQKSPHQEVKIIRCTRGIVYDVVVDLRPDSSTYCKWFGTELTEDNTSMLYIPEGCATGYLTLADNSEITYTASEFYAPDHAAGVKYDDRAFGIQWPGEIKILSDNDMNWPEFQANGSL